MSPTSDDHVGEAIVMARELMVLAGDMDRDGTDDGCCILAGVIRDCAHKLLKEATRERQVHEARSKDPYPQNGEMSKQ